MIAATRAFAAEIDAALDRLDVPALEREYWAQAEFRFIPRFLPPVAVGALLDDVRRLEPDLNRNYIPRHKKGGSVSYYTIADEGPALRTAGRVPLELAVATEPGSLVTYSIVYTTVAYFGIRARDLQARAQAES
jgi:hypothetical protein